MVDAAAALWNANSHRRRNAHHKGTLNEDVSGANIAVSGTNFTVTNQQLDQLGVITARPTLPLRHRLPAGHNLRRDGLVIDAIFGKGVSSQNSARTTASTSGSTT